MFPRGKGGVAAVDSGNYGNAFWNGLARMAPGPPWFMRGVDRGHCFSYGFIPAGRRAGATRCGRSRRAGSLGNTRLHSPELG